MPKRPRVELYKDRKGEHRFRLVAANGEKVLPNESHPTKSQAKRAWRTVQRLAKQNPEIVTVSRRRR